jgi:mannose-1-phosphate guanylyltransferase
MDAIVLVGGQGTRLRPLTYTRHKSLVPVCNQPAIEYLFAWLERSGFERAVLALGQHNEDLADVYRRGRPGKLRVEIVEERERLESGGAIRHAVREAGIEGRFVVLNGDVFVDFDFAPALEAHIARGADLTLALYSVDDPSAYGVAVLDEHDVVVGFVEKPPPGTAPSKLVNAGAWIFEPGLVGEIPPGAVRVEETLFPSLVARRRTVLGYRFPGLWADIGTPTRYLALNHELTATPAVDATATIAADATIERSSVGSGSQVGSNATIRSSVLWERVTVGANATVMDSILADGVTVGDSATLSGIVAGSGASIAAGAIVPPGTLLEPGAQHG